MPKIEKLTEQQQILAEEAVRRAAEIAERYARIFPEYEHDIASSAYYGAVRAASSFEEEKGGVWERWSALAIKGEIKDFLNNSYIKRRQLWPQEALERVETEGAHIALGDSEDALSSLLARLPTRHRQVCELVYREGMTPAEAGRAVGLSKFRGCKIHQEAIAYLREELAA